MKAKSKAGQARANKRAGAAFEGVVRSSLNELGQFVYVKGVSTKGIDIFALKDSYAIFLELKTHSKLSNSILKKDLIQFKENFKIVNDFIGKTMYCSADVMYNLIIYERNVALNFYYINKDPVAYHKTRKINIGNFIKMSLLTEIEKYGI